MVIVTMKICQAKMNGCLRGKLPTKTKKEAFTDKRSQMNVYLISFLFGLSSFFSFSQSLDYLNNDPQWRIDQQIDYYYPCVPTHSYVHYLDGDSIIGNYTYKKVYRHGKTTKVYYGMPPIGDPSFDCFGSEYFFELSGLIRQDNNKFYQYLGVDTLMYDFDLSIGQAAPETSITNSGGWTVTSIDSVLINGNYHQQYYLNNGGFDSTFIIEGVGSMAGLFESYHGFFESDANLLCYAQDEIPYYSRLGSSCDFDVNVTEITPIQFVLYPNPSNEELTVQFENTGIFEIVIKDLKGSRLTEITTMNKFHKLNVSHLESGLYVLEINTDHSHKSELFVVD